MASPWLVEDDSLLGAEISYVTRHQQVSQVRQRNRFHTSSHGVPGIHRRAGKQKLLRHHQGTAWHGRFRLYQAATRGGNVQPGSIKRTGSKVELVLVENDQLLNVVYSGTEAPPDTFKDKSQALAEGSFGH